MKIAMVMAIAVVIGAASLLVNKSSFLRDNGISDELPLEVIQKVDDHNKLREVVTQEYPKLFEAVSASMFAHDPIGINFESNTDEYDPEAVTVIARLSGVNSEEEVTQIVHEEFVNWFGHATAGNRERYTDLGRDIWVLWNKEPNNHRQQSSGPSDLRGTAYLMHVLRGRLAPIFE